MFNKILLACVGGKKGKAIARLRVTVGVIGNDSFIIRGCSSTDGFGALEVIEGDIQVTSFYEIIGLGYGIFESNLGNVGVTLENETTGVSVPLMYEDGAHVYMRETFFEGVEDGQDCIVAVYV